MTNQEIEEIVQGVLDLLPTDTGATRVEDSEAGRLICRLNAEILRQRDKNAKLRQGRGVVYLSGHVDRALTEEEVQAITRLYRSTEHNLDPSYLDYLLRRGDIGQRYCASFQCGVKLSEGAVEYLLFAKLCYERIDDGVLTHEHLDDACVLLEKMTGFSFENR